MHLQFGGGKKTLNYLTCGQEFVKGDESVLKETKYELVVVIANQGYSEDVMDAARKVHAAGGTVIHAKGTGAKKAEKFLGVTLVPEKDMKFLFPKILPCHNLSIPERIFLKLRLIQLPSYYLHKDEFCSILINPIHLYYLQKVHV